VSSRGIAPRRCIKALISCAVTGISPTISCTTEADFSTRTWFISVIHAAGPIQGSTAGATSTVMTPAQIKSWLDAGELMIVGYQDIDGHHTIGLREQPWAQGYRELWVDSQTFLPVRMIMADFASTSGPLKNVPPQ
jgi:hypothetical protein